MMNSFDKPIELTNNNNGQKAACDLAIYIHIPFCVRKCAYCDFLSFPAVLNKQEQYVNALIEEIRFYGKKTNHSTVKTVFIGGGTPSSIPVSLLEKICKTVHDCFTYAKNIEFSIEVNPGTVTKEKLCLYKKAGINRISIGCQSLNDDELKILGRIHDSKTFLKTFEDARSAGFDNINIDLMSAIPGQSFDSWSRTLSKAVSLKPEHISAYSLIIEEGTPFYEHYSEVVDRDNYDVESELISKGKVAELRENSKNADVQWPPLPTENEERAMYDFTEEFLSQNGYHRYEISNYARNDGDYECRHNKAYWTRGEYLGFGIGAASLYKESRWSNPRSIEDYISFWQNKNTDSSIPVKHFVEDYQELSVSEQKEEFILLGLRLCRGISLKDYEDTFKEPIYKDYGQKINHFIKASLLDEKDGRLFFTKKGIAVSNAILAELLY